MEVLLDALSHIPTRVGTACLDLNSLEGKPTTGEGSRVRNLLPQPLHHIDLDEFVPKVRDLHAQAQCVSGGVVLFTLAFNHLYLNYPSDRAGRALDWPPTFVQVEVFWHLASSAFFFFAKFSGKLRGYSLGQGPRQEKSGVRWRGARHS